MNKYVLEDFNDLQRIDLSYNDLQSLPEHLFEFTPSINFLNFSHNKLSIIAASTFEQLKMLQLLDLSHNQIESDKFMTPLENLIHLNLTYNKLKNLTSTLNLKNDELHANFDKNPWNCSFLAEIVGKIDENRFYFGGKFRIGKVEEFLNVSGIECKDLDGVQRTILLVKDKPHVYAPIVQNDQFTHASVLLWLLIGLVVIFLVLKVMKRILKKSEKDAEERFKEKEVKIEELF